MLPYFPVFEQRETFQSDEARFFTSYRLKTFLQFFGRIGAPDSTEVIIDTGAPFSVVPFSLQKEQSLHPEPIPLGTQLTPLKDGTPVNGFAPIKWQEAYCDLGQMNVVLVDEVGRRSPPFLFVGKFPRTKTKSPLEKAILLGMDFFARNKLTLMAQPGRPFLIERRFQTARPPLNASRQIETIGWIQIPPTTPLQPPWTAPVA
jgi:hypothetical protein